MLADSGCTGCGHLQSESRPSMHFESLDRCRPAYAVPTQSRDRLLTPTPGIPRAALRFSLPPQKPLTCSPDCYQSETESEPKELDEYEAQQVQRRANHRDLGGAGGRDQLGEFLQVEAKYGGGNMTTGRLARRHW
jgi:hypothetical protein